MVTNQINHLDGIHMALGPGECMSTDASPVKYSGSDMFGRELLKVQFCKKR